VVRAAYLKKDSPGGEPSHLWFIERAGVPGESTLMRPDADHADTKAMVMTHGVGVGILR
jgi:hypothetical protein